MNEKKYLLLFITFFLLPIKNVTAHDHSHTYSHNALADFIYNFQALIIGGNNGVLCLYGYDEVILNIEERYKSHNILTLKSADADNIKQNCKMVYIGRDREKYSKSIIDKFNQQGILTISFLDNFLDYGGTVNLQIIRRNVVILLNHKQIKNLNIEFNPLIYNLVINKK